MQLELHSTDGVLNDPAVGVWPNSIDRLSIPDADVVVTHEAATESVFRRIRQFAGQRMARAPKGAVRRGGKEGLILLFMLIFGSIKRRGFWPSSTELHLIEELLD